MEEILANHTFNDDKLFLANFIVTNYLGPDVFSEIPRRSVANRLSRRFPPYTSTHLGDSSLTVSQLKSLYYYALRNADPTLILSPAQFHAYLKGDETTYTTNFTTFFPLHLHKHKVYSAASIHEVVKGIVVVINDEDDAPVDDELNRSYIDRFRRLSGSSGLKMDSKSCLTYRPPRPRDDDDDDRDSDPRPVVLFRDGFKRRRVVISDDDDDLDERDFPTAEELAARDATVVVNGKTVTFKLVGLSSDYVVIGISRAAYLFRVALPCLPNNFRGLSCEVWSDGKVEIAQQQQQLHDAGGGLPAPFTLSFYLPGPVDPRLFSPNIRRDGTLEAVVVKKQRGWIIGSPTKLGSS